ncbi:MAG: HAMP domain-containing histidine kinase [Eubacterium sp.]|nr:HAMP domain-containing histidine kinase [Eubacterium sp.]
MKKLRIRFVLAAMGSMFAVLAAIVIGMNVLSYMDVINTSDQELERIVGNGGEYPDPGAARSEGETVSGPASEIGRNPADGSLQVLPPPGSSGETPPPLPNNGISPIGEGEMPPGGAEAPYETRYFTVYFRDGAVVGSHMDNIAAVTETEAEEIATAILNGGSEKGFYEGTYRYRVAAYDKSVTTTFSANNDIAGATGVVYSATVDADTMVCLVNCERRLDAFSYSLWISIIVSLAGALVVFLLVLFTSKLVFRPVEASERKQKQFLTDASHELKTPLAIISANTEVMEMESGETKWIASTRHQVERLTGLVEQMVALTRLDETDFGGEPERISFSDILRETADSYQAPAEVANKKLKTEIGNGIYIRANEKNIRQLIGLLLDNAVKYATPDTTIEVELFSKGKRAVMTVFNHADGIKQGENDILFERFYRNDASRSSETGGSGIGLSVAKSIVERSHGRIKAYSDDGESLRITVTLPIA